jgi:hypothetical protein
MYDEAYVESVNRSVSTGFNTTMYVIRYRERLQYYDIRLRRALYYRARITELDERRVKIATAIDEHFGSRVVHN